MERSVEFDIALSFAGEDRPYVEQVAMLLREKGVKVFYDDFEDANLWGKNLYEYLSDIYQNKALYTVMFISEKYNDKLWSNHERKAMQNRAFQENQEYILPARFDQTVVPGLLSTIGYISLIDKTAKDFVEIILRKLISSGRTVPSESLRNSLSPLIKVPKADPQKFDIVVTDEKNSPITDAFILLIADNNTFLKQVTDGSGTASFNINTRRRYKVLFAHSNYPSYIIEQYIDPINNISIQIHSSDNIGSIICEDGTGYINGLKGRLAPILDSSNRTYLYANNIAINGGEIQPVHFSINEPLNLEDCEGMIMQVSIKFIQGNSSLIEYVKPLTE